MRDFPYRGCGELHNLGDMSGYCKDVLQLQRWFTLLYSLRVLRTVLSVARVVLDNHELLAATAGRIKANRRNNHPVHERAQLTAGPAWDHRSTHRPASLLIVPEFALIWPLSRPVLRVQKLNEFTRVPEYIAYLAYILAFMNNQEDRIRTIAGYLLKNNARLILRAAPEVVAYVKASVLQAFFDPSMMVRNAAGQDIVSFMGILEPRNWPECLQQLVNTLDSPTTDHQEVSSYFLGSQGSRRWRQLPPVSWRDSVPRVVGHIAYRSHAGRAGVLAREERSLFAYERKAEWAVRKRQAQSRRSLSATTESPCGAPHPLGVLPFALSFAVSFASATLIFRCSYCICQNFARDTDHDVISLRPRSTFSRRPAKTIHASWTSRSTAHSL